MPISPFPEGVFDIEADALLDEVTKVHCIVVACGETGQFLEFGHDRIKDGLNFLNACGKRIAHNGIKYDYAAINKLYGIDWEYDPNTLDTLVLTRLLYSNIKDLDSKWRTKWGLPGKLFGSHSLEAWGHRLGEHKGGFGKTCDWKTYSPEMMEYCRQDVVVTLKLWHRLREKLPDYAEASVIEHDIAWLMARQERNGFVFDERLAMMHYAEWSNIRDKMTHGLRERFGCWYVSEGVRVPKRTVNAKPTSKAMSTCEGAAYTKIKLVEFNPSSRQHIARVLIQRGWKPKDFTESGQPMVDETILLKLPYPEAKVLADYFTMQKRLGQLAEGDQAWLKSVKQDGRIHGSVNPNGAVTGRATHSYPNVAQVPGCRSYLGAECRTLFTVPPGWFLMGSDASGLELRCLGHFMAKWDNGAYIKEILHGDIHTTNQLAAGLPTRDDAKTFIYAFLYGAGDEKIGSIVAPTATATKQRAVGKALKAKFLQNTPALRYLREAVAQAAKRGWLKGLDGRKVYVRSEHAALNTLLQSAGALVCKLWCIEVDKLARAKGLRHDWGGDYAFCAWVHDEVQIACRTREIAKQMGAICKEAMKAVERYFKFKCPLDSEFNIGQSWKDTH